MLFAVYYLRGLFMIGIVKTDGCFSALSCHFLRRQFFAVHEIRYFFRNRKLPVCSSLIINIFAFRLPGKLITVLGKGFIAFYIFNVLQIRSVLNDGCPVFIFQPFADNHILSAAVRICHNIHRFFLSGFPILCTGS